MGDARIHIYTEMTGTISLTFKKSLRKKVYLSSLPEAIRNSLQLYFLTSFPFNHNNSIIEVEKFNYNKLVTRTFHAFI